MANPHRLGANRRWFAHSPLPSSGGRWASVMSPQPTARGEHPTPPALRTGRWPCCSCCLERSAPVLSGCGTAGAPVIGIPAGGPDPHPLEPPHPRTFFVAGPLCGGRRGGHGRLRGDGLRLHVPRCRPPLLFLRCAAGAGDWLLGRRDAMYTAAENCSGTTGPGISSRRRRMSGIPALPLRS